MWRANPEITTRIEYASWHGAQVFACHHLNAVFRYVVRHVLSNPLLGARADDVVALGGMHGELGLIGTPF
eukprot:6488263-Amphidinium_carterae.2